jgi:FtsZ-interacting cell division protein YlmF
MGSGGYLSGRSPKDTGGICDQKGIYNPDGREEEEQLFASYLEQWVKDEEERTLQDEIAKPENVAAVRPSLPNRVVVQMEGQLEALIRQINLPSQDRKADVQKIIQLVEDLPTDSPMHQQGSGKRPNVTIFRSANSFEAIMQVALHVKRREIVLLDLGKTEPILRSRMLTFASGISFAFSMDMEHLGDFIYLFNPHSPEENLEEVAQPHKLDEAGIDGHDLKETNPYFDFDYSESATYEDDPEERTLQNYLAKTENAVVELSLIHI